MDKTQFATLQHRLAQLRGFFDLPNLQNKLKALEDQIAQQSFWNDPQTAQKIILEANQLKEKIQPILNLEEAQRNILCLFDLIQEHPDEPSLQTELHKELSTFSQNLDQAELKILLSDPRDINNAIVSLHAGAGGTEACDWVSMLLRMITRYAESRGYTTEILDILPGEEAGIKSATLIVRGPYAYAYLKSESGVHRLVRISPFNAQGKRQTSFASIDVIPEIDDTIEIKIEEKDLRIDVFRASGHGGQGVNTTDSAVRITHLPTGLVVTCQNERSQLKNKATALKVLRSRLYEMELDKKRAEAEKHYSEKGEIAWGRQIRSYVFHPYQMVKDLRTGEQTSDIQAVMDGQLLPFAEAFIRGKKRIDPSPNQAQTD
ncbi:MAG: peptide chain release factor 2 [Verrucomicrobiae bacterium]|nr:peptide chain release factor 2 [Verrucomicrobiae bacterium]